MAYRIPDSVQTVKLLCSSFSDLVRLTAAVPFAPRACNYASSPLSALGSIACDSASSLHPPEPCPDSPVAEQQPINGNLGD